MPAERLMSALTGAGGVASGQGGGERRAATPDGDISLRYVPVKDGRTLTVHPFHPGASELSATVPIMCGSNETEGVPYQNPDDPFWKSEIADEGALRDAGQARASRRRCGGGPPDWAVPKEPAERQPRRSGARSWRPTTRRCASRRMRLRSARRRRAQAPVYMYLFKWRSPVNNGKLRSMHCMELPFVFDHVDNTPFMNGAGKDRYALAETMSEAWVSFARTGNPNHNGLARVAGVRHHEARDDGVRYRVQGRQRSVRRGAAGDAGSQGAAGCGQNALDPAPFDWRARSRVALNVRPGPFAERAFPRPRTWRRRQSHRRRGLNLASAGPSQSRPPWTIWLLHPGAARDRLGTSSFNARSDDRTTSFSI